MGLSSSNTGNATSGIQNPSVHECDRLLHEGDNLWINMVKSHINVATQSRNYISPEAVPGLESPLPLEIPLQIEKLEPLPHIPKGVIKHSTHKPNSRVSQNYSIVEYLGQTLCVM
jgi:hypothetical protein